MADVSCHLTLGWSQTTPSSRRVRRRWTRREQRENQRRGGGLHPCTHSWHQSSITNHLPATKAHTGTKRYHHHRSVDQNITDTFPSLVGIMVYPVRERRGVWCVRRPLPRGADHRGQGTRHEPVLQAARSGPAAGCGSRRGGGGGRRRLRGDPKAEG